MTTGNWRWWWLLQLPDATAAAGISRSGESALNTTYILGFKDGFLVAVAFFSILLVLFRRGA